jgi:hypothetical protein
MPGDVAAAPSSLAAVVAPCPAEQPREERGPRTQLRRPRLESRECLGVLAGLDEIARGVEHADGVSGAVDRFAVGSICFARGLGRLLSSFSV